jgi:hypothetical protein
MKRCAAIALGLLAGCATLHPDVQRAKAVAAAFDIDAAVKMGEIHPSYMMDLSWDKEWLGPETLADGKCKWTRSATIDGRAAVTLNAYRFASPNAVAPYYWTYYAGDVGILRSLKTFTTLEAAQYDALMAFSRMYNFARDSIIYFLAFHELGGEYFEEPLAVLEYWIYGWEPKT